MLFNSYFFILFFLPLSILLFFSLNRRGLRTQAKLSLLGMSLWFYGFFNIYYVFLLCGSIALNYAISRLVIEGKLEKRARKAILVTGIVLNVALIGYFKYLDFAIANINALFGFDLALRNIIIPLSISFFTFEQIAYIIDSYRGETKLYSFLDYALFETFFPKLIAGPIVLHGELIPQFGEKGKAFFNYANFSSGIMRFAAGLAKKILIADTFGSAVGWGFGNVQAMTSMDTLIVILAYTFQIYFDFSGYCDMAIGAASMLNITLPENFNAPYRATSITEFWQRWHMTLTRFLRKYLYFPLGGSKKGSARTYINIIIVFLVSGIWHGANWTFVLWGALHGIGNVLTRAMGKKWERMHVAVRWALTFLFLNATWVFFRATSVSQALSVFRAAAKFDSFGISVGLMDAFNSYPVTYLMTRFEALAPFYGTCMFAYLAVGFMLIFARKTAGEYAFKPNKRNALLAIALLIWPILSFGGASSFLYFNF